MSLIEGSASIITYSSIAENAPRPSMSALHPSTPSRSQPDQLRMTLGELKACKINENKGFGLQLACCAPGLTTPESACGKVRGSLGGASHEQGIDEQISMKMHRISTNTTDPAAGRPSRPKTTNNDSAVLQRNPFGTICGCFICLDSISISPFGRDKSEAT